MLDVVGFNYADSRYELDAELFPHRVIVGSETFPAKIDVMWALVDAAAARDRRLHLDRLGLPRRGRHRPRRLHGCRGLRRRPDRRPAPVPARRVRRHRHHRPPPHRLVLPRDRLRAAHATRTSPCTARSTTAGRPPSRPGRGTTRSHAGRWDVPSRLARSRSTCTAMPTRSSCCSTASLARRGARSARRRRSARGSTTEYRPGELVAVARTGGVRDRAPRAAHGVGDDPPGRARPSARVAADSDDLAFVEITLTDAAGTVVVRRRPRRDGQRRRPRRARRASARAAPAPRSPSARRGHDLRRPRARDRAPDRAREITVTVSADGVEPRP